MGKKLGRRRCRRSLLTVATILPLTALWLSNTSLYYQMILSRREGGIESLAPLEQALRSFGGKEPTRPRPPPRNGTVMWHCHYGGDPNAEGAGITKQLRNFLGAYIVAQERHAHLYKGNLSYEYTDNTPGGCNAPLEALVDLEALPDLAEMLVDAPVGEEIDPSCEPCGYNYPYDWTPGRIATYLAARRAFAIAPRLRARAPWELCPPASCVCLHARLEKDFVRWAGTLAGNEALFAKRLNDHVKRGGFTNATTLYVVGQRGDAYQSIGQFSSLTHHLEDTGLRMFENALIDQEICQVARYHVGTSLSIFDQWISEHRVLHNRSRSLDLRGNVPLHDFDEKKMHPFIHG